MATRITILELSNLLGGKPRYTRLKDGQRLQLGFRMVRIGERFGVILLNPVPYDPSESPSNGQNDSSLEMGD